MCACVCREHQGVLKLPHEDLHDQWTRFYRSTEDLGLPLTPKYHLMAHAIGASPYTGNPGRFACFQDESVNRELANICRGSHASTFERTVLSKFAATYSGEGAHVRKRVVVNTPEEETI